MGPVFFAFSNLIELLFNLCREVVIHDAWEVLHKEVVHHGTYIGRNELALVGSSHLRLAIGRQFAVLQSVDAEATLGTFLVTLLHVATLLYGADCWSVC